MIAILSPQHELPRDERIRVAFADNQMSLSSFTHFLADAGFWSEAELGSFAFRAQLSEVRRALKTRDESNLPFAGPTTLRDDEGAPVWTQRRLWALSDYGTNIAEYGKKIQQRSEIRQALIREAISRFGESAVEDAVGEPIDEQ